MFLARMLEIPPEEIGDIEMKNTELLPDEIGDKFSRLDLNMKVGEKIINIEIQVCNQEDYKDRALFYWSKLFTSELKSGEEYDKLKESICINIVNFNLFKESKEFHSHFKVMEKDRLTVLSDKFAIHFFELRKINKNPDKNNPQELWLQLINAETEEELGMLENTNVKEIKEAVMIVREMNADEHFREVVRLREKRLHDEASIIRTAENKGRREGLAEGMTKGIEKTKTIFKLSMKGYTVKQIAEELGIPVEEINSILS